MSTKKLTVKIESLFMFTNGDVPGDKPAEAGDKKNNAVLAMLLSPSTTQNVISVRQFNLPINQPLNLDVTDFFESGLFKNEEVVDETKLQIKITDRDEEGKVGKFFLGLFSKLLGVGLGAATGGLGTFLSGVTGFGIDAVTGAIKDAGNESVSVIGEAEVRLRMDDLPQSLRQHITFTAPDDIELSFFEMDDGRVVEKTLKIAKGNAVGFVILDLTTTLV